MNDINDKSFRTKLAERFLDCDTTADEERQLALFYAKCIHDGCIPQGEDEMCRLVTATVLADTHTDWAEADVSATAEHQETTHDTETSAKPSRRLMPWHWLAAACAAGIVVAGLFVAFAGKDSNAPLLAVGDTARVQQDAAARTEEPLAPDAYTATHKTDGAKDRLLPTAPDASRPPQQTDTPRQPRHNEKTAATPKAHTTPGNISTICNMAAATFSDATDIAVERKGNALLLSTADSEGTCCRYIVHETDGGHITLIEL